MIIKTRFIIIILILFYSCTSKIQTKSDSLVKEDSVDLKKVISFFDYEGKIKKEHIEFYSKTVEYPIRSIGLEKIELKDALLYKDLDMNDLEILILDNPSETSVDFFYKIKNKKVRSMIEFKHYPSDIKIEKLNDTLLVCQFYWIYDFGSNLYDIKKYYFFGNNNGLFKYGYGSFGDKKKGLDLKNVKYTNNSIVIPISLDSTSCIINPDTILTKEMKNIIEPWVIPFDSITFSRL